METISTEMAYEESKESFTELLLELQSRDASVERWKHDVPEGHLCLARSSKDNWRIDYKSLLHYKGAIYIPNDQAVGQEIMRMNHNNPHGSNFGMVRTAELVHHKYFWMAIVVNIKEYVCDCNICQRVKAPWHKPYGELQSLPIPERPWKSISINMITGLPLSVNGNSKAFNAIFIVVDRFTKMAKYFPIRKTTNAVEFADLFYKKIV